MSETRQRRQSNELAFVLHSYPYRETSLILDVFSREFGRLAVVARGARRPRSAVRGVLMSFQPLLLSWFGRGEVKTLHDAEWQGGQPYLQGTALMCGFYLNELLLNLLIRDDPHPQLFDYYQATLYRLAHESDVAATLRCFEKHMLQELGYALELSCDAETGQQVLPDRRYRFVLEQGAVLDCGESQQGVPVLGKTLLDMQQDDYSDKTTALQSKQLMRVLLHHYLGGKTLYSRELIKDLRRND